MFRHPLRRLQLSAALVLVAGFVAVPSTASAAVAPAPVAPVPSARQLDWHTRDMYAFLHFGINTFTDKEWGDGTESPSLFNPTQLDARQWVRTLKDAGFKMVILTAKHHDGFVLWQSATTNYGVKSSPWKDGQGDVVREVADAAREEGLKFGVYLSPWDRNTPTYGRGEAYNTFYKQQLTELMTNYGEISEVWWDGAKGDNTPQTYDFAAWVAIVRQHQPNAVIFGPEEVPGRDIRWVGNENGHAPDNTWSIVDAAGNPTPNGSLWVPTETDVSIRPGWFYHDHQNSQVKSLEDLVDIYESSIGRNSSLLLNVPPDKRGLIPEPDVTRLREFKASLDQAQATDLAAGATATASDNRGAGFEPTKLNDGNNGTYWAANDGATTGWAELDLGANKTFDTVELQEPIEIGQRVTSFNVQAWTGTAWTTVHTNQAIGAKRIAKFPAVTASKVRVNILTGRGSAALSTIRIFNQGTTTTNLARSATSVTASNVHSSGYEAAKAADGSDSTRWATSDATTSAWLEYRFAAPVSFGKTVIKQAYNQRIKDYQIQYWNGSTWVNAFNGSDPDLTQTNTFTPVTSDRIRLNIASIRSGALSPTISEFEVYPAVDPNLNLAKGKNATASNVHSSGYEADKAIDGSTATRWATADGTTNAWLQINLGGITQINKSVIRQAYNQRIGDYQIQYWNGVSFVDAYRGSKPGVTQTDTFPAVSTDKIRLNITSGIPSRLSPTIWELELYDTGQ
jgi:alpha-L-fucosidase